MHIVENEKDNRYWQEEHGKKKSWSLDDRDGFKLEKIVCEDHSLGFVSPFKSLGIVKISKTMDIDGKAKHENNYSHMIDYLISCKCLHLGYKLDCVACANTILIYEHMKRHFMLTIET